MPPTHPRPRLPSTLLHSHAPHCPHAPLRTPIHHPTHRHASGKTKPQTDKSRILERPTRFNPPSHAARRVKPRMYPGPDLNARQRAEQQARKYPNMFPPEGSWLFWFLTQRRVHVWITLSTLLSLAMYSITRSFLATTIYASELPTRADFSSHPFQSLSQLLHVYKLHVSYESEQVAEKRRRKLEDAEKRKEFLRAHGVEPGFLTGSWMEKFGTVEGDRVREGLGEVARMERERDVEGVDGVVVDGEGVVGEGSPVAPAAVQAQGLPRTTDRGMGAPVNREEPSFADGEAQSESANARGEKRKRKLWLGIW